MRINRNNTQSTNRPIPQPGEIWEVSRLVQSPLEFSNEEQQSLYPSSVQRFLEGNSPPRYVMIVKEPEPSVEAQQWAIATVMLLSVKTKFLNDVDLLIPSKMSEVGQNLLAETWHVVPALTCNLLQPVGKRLSREIYDHLLAVGNYYHGLIEELPVVSETYRLGLISGNLNAAKDSAVQAFHQQEEAWSDVLTVPVAAYQTYLESIKFTNAVLDEALHLEQE
ncbi:MULTISPECIES: hypothetical protein [Nostoc]|uniref:Uncharacterized protein n=2 Tax=Nostoc TaxID=1177 RepID=A0ABR8IKH0_9NOSO|nr:MULTISPECIES: hypothetical protein [Nostoc]MBD2564827.1 hypothetical protein [Nostoc linckia FACHB-391]MBD2651456.1 hypothetical protein [Nostoc foliaceum FACHB-393]